ncbi:hypothetical protein BCON_0358g00110 [Botryotinia convoluta]|uniref:Uncharacterized protein n=1 Tax=Botryotinia convoluta TaxID=54673 RepID=A0A4Z1HC87_9HELO|nr:hypothetical protein BCON_0358g00110 [Botryotinia convoluta]
MAEEIHPAAELHPLPAFHGWKGSNGFRRTGTGACAIKGTLQDVKLICGAHTIRFVGAALQPAVH